MIHQSLNSHFVEEEEKNKNKQQRGTLCVKYNKEVVKKKHVARQRVVDALAASRQLQQTVTEQTDTNKSRNVRVVDVGKDAYESCVLSVHVDERLYLSVLLNRPGGMGEREKRETWSKHQQQHQHLCPL